MSLKFFSIIFLIVSLQSACQTNNKDNTQKKLKTTTQIDSQAQKTKDSLELVREIEEEAKPVYIETFKTVHEIKTYVEMAEKGEVNKSEVIAMYNEKLAPGMGKLTTLSQIKKRLDTAGDAYIEFKFKKACAEIALSKAAEQKFKANMLDSSKH